LDLHPLAESGLLRREAIGVHQRAFIGRRFTDHLETSEAVEIVEPIIEGAMAPIEKSPPDRLGLAPMEFEKIGENVAGVLGISARGTIKLFEKTLDMRVGVRLGVLFGFTPTRRLVPRHVFGP
jgi:hypothetical protein